MEACEFISHRHELWAWEQMSRLLELRCDFRDNPLECGWYYEMIPSGGVEGGDVTLKKISRRNICDKKFSPLKIFYLLWLSRVFENISEVFISQRDVTSRRFCSVIPSLFCQEALVLYLYVANFNFLVKVGSIFEPSQCFINLPWHHFATPHMLIPSSCWVCQASVSPKKREEKKSDCLSSMKHKCRQTRQSKANSSKSAVHVPHWRTRIVSVMSSRLWMRHSLRFHRRRGKDLTRKGVKQ